MCSANTYIIMIYLLVSKNLAASSLLRVVISIARTLKPSFSTLAIISPVMVLRRSVRLDYHQSSMHKSYSKILLDYRLPRRLSCKYSRLTSLRPMNLLMILRRILTGFPDVKPRRTALLRAIQKSFEVTDITRLLGYEASTLSSVLCRTVTQDSEQKEGYELCSTQRLTACYCHWITR